MLRFRERSRFLTSEALLLALALASGFAVIWFSYTHEGDPRLAIVAGITFTLSLVTFVRLLADPDSVRARQSDSVLRIASKTLDCMADGLTREAAQKICELLLPETAAITVAITDRERVLGYAGYSDGSSMSGRRIRTRATRAALEDGLTRILDTPAEIGLPHPSRVRAAIIVPLYVGRQIRGTLKFYYRHSRQMSRTQESMAMGFAELLSTQMAASALEEQTRLATSMELKALQAQINPHFLFNTINTIASLIRTDPISARRLLREFAVFYRRTLEESADLIALEREVDQVSRYFAFELARFGDERLALEVDVDPVVGAMLVPSFIVQPLVENAVRHALPAEGRLTVRVFGRIEGDRVVIGVVDDGMGMSAERLSSIMSPESSQGLGIAVKNVCDRMRGYFGEDAHMSIDSAEGKGTSVTFTLKRAAMDAYATAEGAGVAEGFEKGGADAVSGEGVSAAKAAAGEESPRLLAADDPVGYEALRSYVGSDLAERKARKAP
ncbi:histidine kinase [Eggerthellaceae bacterium zg-997]|nr:histidine kinase [Eggerthellaceae bacterium zg-997]